MAATSGSLLAPYASYATSAPFLASAFVNPNSEVLLDLLQIVKPGVGVVVAVQNNGTVNFSSTGLTAVNGSSAASSYTVQGTLVGQFIVLSGGLTDTVAHAVASAFPLNPQSLDILQVLAPGGNVGYYFSYAGVATGS